MTESGDTLKRVREYSSPVEAEVAKSVLDSAGIESVIHGEFMSAIYAYKVAFKRLLPLANQGVFNLRCSTLDRGGRPPHVL